jgi:hypothetical protein
MIAIRTDTSNIRSTLKALQASAAPGTEDFVISVSAAALRKTGLRSRFRFTHGTNRFARGWLRAHNALLIGHGHLAQYGLASIALPPLTRSALVDDAYQMLRTRAERSDKRLRELRGLRAEIASSTAYADTPRGQAAKRATLAKLDKEINRIGTFQVRADNEIQKFEGALRTRGALVMFGKSTKRDFGLSNIERIFPSEFGATARTIRAGNRVTVEINHNEPHATIVERRSRVWATALSDVRTETAGFVSTSAGGNASAAFYGRISKGLSPGTRVVRSSGGAIVAKVGGR